MKVMVQREEELSKSKIPFIKIILILSSLAVIWQPSASWLDAIDLETACRQYIEKAGPNFQKIDINTATEEDLIALPGIGIKTARAIVAFKESIGGYKKLDQLLLVRGVGDKTYNCLIKLVTIKESQ